MLSTTHGSSLNTYNPDGNTKRIRDEIQRTKRRYVSAVVIHEVYQLSLKKEGREVAKMRVNLILSDFKVVNVNAEIAILSAELRKSYGLSLADSTIAATSKILNAQCVTDDPHFDFIKEIKTKWI